MIITAGILVQPAGDNTLDAVADAFVGEFVGANPPWDIPRTALSFRTEPGRLLDPIPALGSYRVVFIIHNGREYRLMFHPSPVNPDGSLYVQPGNIAFDKFQALYESIMNSFSFLVDPADPAGTLAVPLTCADPDQPLFIDAETRTCSAVPPAAQSTPQ